MFSHIVAKLITYFLSIKMVLLKKKKTWRHWVQQSIFSLRKVEGEQQVVHLVSRSAAFTFQFALRFLTSRKDVL